MSETWERIEDDLEDFGIKLFMRLFKIAPKALRLFSFRGQIFVYFVVQMSGFVFSVFEALHLFSFGDDNITYIRT